MMSMYITPTSFTNQELGYQNKALSLVKSDVTIDWDSYYVYVTQSEKETMSDFSQVMKIISETSQSPSDMIGLKKSDILCDKIHVLNKEYNEAITNYKISLKICNGKDLNKINELNQNYKSTTLKITAIGTPTISGITALSSAGAGALSGAWGGPIGAGIGGLIGFVVGGVTLFFVTRKQVNDYIMYEGSRQRIAWLKEIDTLEKKRFEKIKTELTLCATKLVKELKEMENRRDPVCTKKVLELLQIERVFKATFPGSSFDVKNGLATENVSSLLTNINNKFLITHNQSIF